MEKLIDQKGINHVFEKLVYNEKNLTKVNLTFDSKQPEGIWIVVSDEDKLKVDDDNSRDEYFVAMLANDALNFYPNRSWGMHILCKTNGSERPKSDLSWVDYSNNNNLIFSDDVNQK